MTGPKPHQFNIPGRHEYDGFTKAELEAILNGGLEEAGVEIETSPREEIIDLGERLRDVRQSELDKAA